VTDGHIHPTPPNMNSQQPSTDIPSRARQRARELAPTLPTPLFPSLTVAAPAISGTGTNGQIGNLANLCRDPPPRSPHAHDPKVRDLRGGAPRNSPLETRRVSKGEHRWIIHSATPSLTRRVSNLPASVLPSAFSLLPLPLHRLMPAPRPTILAPYGGQNRRRFGHIFGHPFQSTNSLFRQGDCVSVPCPVRLSIFSTSCGMDAHRITAPRDECDLCDRRNLAMTSAIKRLAEVQQLRSYLKRGTDEAKSVRILAAG
jgi:hypothetical protein